MTSFEDTLRHAMIGFALDGIAAHKALLDAVGYRPTTAEELAALRDSEASDYHAGVQCALCEDALGPCECEG